MSQPTLQMDAISESAWQRLHSRIDKSGGHDACWPFTGRRNARGYGQLKVCVSGGRSIAIPAHRLAYVYANGSLVKRLCVCHRCDFTPCCNPAHLFAAPQADNIRDMDLKGRRKPASGLLNGSSKLTPQIVREMREKRASGMAIRAIARQYPQVSRQTVRNAIRGKTWSEVN